MGAKRKVRTFEIGRDQPGCGSGWYKVGTALQWHSGLNVWVDYADWFCPEIFHRLTGIRLKPGEKRRYKLVEVK